RCSVRYTSCSTMIGPETESPASTGPLAFGTAVLGSAGTVTGDAAFVTPPTGVFSSPHPTARNAAPSPTRIHSFRMTSPCSYQPSQYQIFPYIHKNGLRKNTYPEGDQPTRTFPRPSIPARITPCSFGTATRAKNTVPSCTIVP